MKIKSNLSKTIDNEAEFLESHEDYLLAVARLEEKNSRISYEEIRKELRLDN